MKKKWKEPELKDITSLVEEVYFVYVRGYNTMVIETLNMLEVFKKVVSEMTKCFRKMEPVFRVLSEMSEIGRTTEDIKRDLKYEKNPMRIKQLNEELNRAYIKKKGSD